MEDVIDTFAGIPKNSDVESQQGISMFYEERCLSNSAWDIELDDNYGCNNIQNVFPSWILVDQYAFYDRLDRPWIIGYSKIIYILPTIPEVDEENLPDNS